MSMVLVVDDEVEIQRLLHRILVREGHYVETTGSGQEAIEMIRFRSYDVVFLDVRLPFISVQEVLHSIKNKSVDTYIVIMSGKPLEYRVKSVLSEESNEFVQKPFQVREIREVMGKIVVEGLERKG